MTAVAVIGFAIGTVAMFVRVVTGMGKTHPSHGVGFVIAFWIFMAFTCLLSGVIAAVLLSVVAEPVISFVQRVDALERRCPSDVPRSR